MAFTCCGLNTRCAGLDTLNHNSSVSCFGTLHPAIAQAQTRMDRKVEADSTGVIVAV
jgi:hypothetical protein